MSGGQAAGYQSHPIYSFSIPASGGYDLAGNIKSVTDLTNGTWVYTYDTQNRLLTANASSGQYAGHYGCWAYDGFGNRTAENWGTTACQSPETSVPVSATYNALNRVTWTSVHSAVSGFSYDAAGDVTNDNAYQYVYDGEGRICAVKDMVGTMTAYIYDGEGHRVAKGTPSTWGNAACIPANITVTSRFVLGIGGEQLTEQTVTNGTATWTHTNVFAGGKLLATYEPADSSHVADTYFSMNDWLGTKRGEVSADGLYLSTDFSLPYGNQLTITGNTPSSPSATEHHFTGKERDAETGVANGNDYFGARYFASSMGRFMSPDWSARVEPVPYAKLDDPQTLNLYAYVTNNPMGRADIDGHAPLSWGGFEDCSERHDCGGGGQNFLEIERNMESQLLQNQPTYMSREGQDFVKGWEQFSLTVYDASGKANKGDWTIGWGHKTGKGTAPVDVKGAEKLFQKDVARMSRAVARDLKVSVTQNQFDALVSLRFNAGAGNVTPPVTDLNRTGQATKADFTEHYITAQGVFQQGLLKRRTAEWNMFNEGVYDATH
jgi:RHS repeat-associated protein